MLASKAPDKKEIGGGEVLAMAPDRYCRVWCFPELDQALIYTKPAVGAWRGRAG